jgi:glutamine synthetase
VAVSARFPTWLAARRSNGGLNGRSNGKSGRSNGQSPEAQREKAVRAVLKATAERDISFLRLWFTDVLGFMKSFAIPAEELEKAFTHGVVFDGSAIQGFARRREEDLLARPDPFTFQLLPWRPESQTATMFCDILTLEGDQFPGDPRAVLRRQVAECESLGLHPFFGPEIEFFLFQDEGGTTLLDHGTYFDVTTIDVSSDFRKTVIRYLEQLGIPVEESHHEVAESQHEIDLRFAPAMTMADSIMTFRLAVKEAARESGIYATFMPKPIQAAWGNGMHLHLTLLRDGGNAFASLDPSGLSPEGRAFVAGVLANARAITAITNQWVNSYKRLVPGFEAPVQVSWGRANRSALVRVPPARNGDARVEIRSPDPACNPYLAFAAILGAGLEGIRFDLELLPELTEDEESTDPLELDAGGIEHLPESLGEAVLELEESALVRRILGDHVLDWIVRNKLEEWESYRVQVTPFELERYLPVL